MGILSWIVFGLVVGIIAKLVTPGRDPGGFIVTMLLGIAGALLGGCLGRAMGFYGQNESAGWLMSIAGAILLLVLYRLVARRRTAIARDEREREGAREKTAGHNTHAHGSLRRKKAATRVPRTRFSP